LQGEEREDARQLQSARDFLATDPRQTELLAREGRILFPNSPYADERDFLLVAAVFNQGRIERAKLEAHYYFERHHTGRFAKDATALTGISQ
jgi:hypothetical protein